MPSFFVETYLARDRSGERAALDERAGSAAAELTRRGVGIRFERSIYVPEDEVCFFVFDAQSGAAAARVAEDAGLVPFRVVEAISTSNEDP
jgi:hypothetical protein